MNRLYRIFPPEFMENRQTVFKGTGYRAGYEETEKNFSYF